MGVLDTGKGLIREGSGSAVFNLKYKCICMKPFKGQVMDVVVTSVNKVPYIDQCRGVVQHACVALGRPHFLLRGALHHCLTRQCLPCAPHCCFLACRWGSLLKRARSRCLCPTT